MYVYDSIVSWNSRKQKTVALSSAEAEYMAIAAVVQEVKWVNMLLNEIMANGGDQSACESASDGVMCDPSPTIIYTDSQSAMALCTNDGHHARTKHIDIRHHFIREYMKSKCAVLKWVPTVEQIADILTKALGRQTYEKVRQLMMGERRME